MVMFTKYLRDFIAQKSENVAELKTGKKRLEFDLIFNTSFHCQTTQNNTQQIIGNEILKLYHKVSHLFIP